MIQRRVRLKIKFGIVGIYVKLRAVILPVYNRIVLINCRGISSVLRKTEIALLLVNGIADIRSQGFCDLNTLAGIQPDGICHLRISAEGDLGRRFFHFPNPVFCHKDAGSIFQRRIIVGNHSAVSQIQRTAVHEDTAAETVACLIPLIALGSLQRKHTILTAYQIQTGLLLGSHLTTVICFIIIHTSLQQVQLSAAHVNAAADRSIC